MEHALHRTWSLCMTSENHGTVGPAGCTFSHAPEKHERVLVVEAPAGTRAPVAEFKGYVDGQPAVTWFDRDNMPRVGTKLFAAPVELPAGQVAMPNGVMQAARAIRDEQAAACATDPLLALREMAADDEEALVSARLLVDLLEALVPPAQAAPLPVQPAAAPAEPIECWSHNEEDFNAQSLGELIDTHELQPGATVWVGEAVHPEPSSLFNTDWLIENMGEAAYDIAGEHGGEDYPNVSDEQVAELEALVVGWITKFAPPTFWTVKNVRPYVLTAEDCGDQASTPGERQEGGAA